ncbi:MAG TPA: deoxyribose-phosphate aldolase [Mycobacterium sp.]|nr:deoxyribose-phosphate aldolase [Mycobacterium sp.]
MRLTRDTLAKLVDHTLLKPEATAADVTALMAEAVELGTYAVCVSPSMVSVATSARPSDGPVVASVAGFPSGKHLTEIKAREAELAVTDGASEVDMVIDVGAALTGDWDAVHADIAGVRSAIPGVTLKVIIESAALAELCGWPLIVDVCQIAADAGADFVKTSTGFHPSGGATPRAVALMAGAVGDRLGVKASGGIRTAEQARILIDNGATRLGLSGTRGVLEGLKA